MRTYLERIEPQSRMARFYAVTVVPTLFREWAVLREWGRIGQGGTVRQQVHADEETACRSAEGMISKKERRGYRQRASAVQDPRSSTASQGALC